MRRMTVALATLCVLLSPMAVHADGRMLYVGTTGSDSTGDGSSAKPWASPGYASRQLAPGDTLTILHGRYLLDTFDEDIITPPSGTSGAWITICGETGARPVLAGGDNLMTAIHLSGVSYLRLEHLEITHDATASGAAAYFREAITGIDAPLSHVVFSDLYIHHVDEFGIDLADVSDLTIADCRIEYCGFGAIGGPEGSESGWQDVTIEDCSLSYGGHYYQGGDGSDRPYDRPDGLGLEPSAGPLTIVGCTAEHNYGDGLDSKLDNTTIERCVVANNSCDGVKLWGDDSRVENTLIFGRGDGDSQTTPWSPIVITSDKAGARFELVNVTVDDALGHNYSMHVQYDYPATPVDLLIRNCIFSARASSSAVFIAGASMLTADHNLFYMPEVTTIVEYGEADYTAGTISSLGSGNLYGDPRFWQTAWGSDGDYQLGYGSPAIDAGTTEDAPTVDINQNARDGSPDIGAYEFIVRPHMVSLPMLAK